MASVKRLKKETDYLVSELIIDCFSYMGLVSDANNKKTFLIIQETLALRKEVRHMANHPDGKDNPKLVKAHYKATADKLGKGIEAGYKKLEKLVLK